MSLTHHNYYEDREYVSNSMLSNISVSPEYFKHMYDNQQSPTTAMKLGSAIHMMILEPMKFTQHYAIQPKFDKRTKQGKIDSAEFEKQNQFKTIISESDYALCEQICFTVMREIQFVSCYKTVKQKKLLLGLINHMTLNVRVC